MLPSKTLLMPGPWTAKGNTIRDGTGRTVAYVVTRNATAHAHWIAEIPKLIAGIDSRTPIDDQTPEELLAKIAELEAKVSDLESENCDLQSDLTVAEQDLAAAEAELKKLRPASPAHI